MGRVGGWSGHIYLRVAILAQGNSVLYFDMESLIVPSSFFLRTVLRSATRVLGWVAVGNPVSSRPRVRHLMR